MGKGIDQPNLHSVQPGYLMILQMGNADPRHKSRKTEYEVKPQYQKLSKQLTCNMPPSQLGGRHSNPVVTTPMIALDFSDTTQQSASHNVAPNQNQQQPQVDTLSKENIKTTTFQLTQTTSQSSTICRQISLAKRPKAAGHPIATLKTQRFNLSKRRTAYVTLSVARYLATGSSIHLMVAPSNATAEISSQHSKMLTNTCRSIVDPCISAPAASINHSTHNYCQQITMRHAYVISTDSKFTRLELQ
ncbi:hypothetical protein F511_29133 [Dorcoceras hygrometricum]|uniref:Uncharacterized protein n=1 Tax=Dorcoceras hygrometricum TaxID=472368 RepID=A0A2Z7BWM8_9LAMI|nr:hypothetical protein F511_29133 [Dorcoceras hygrometricum]